MPLKPRTPSRATPRIFPEAISTVSFGALCFADRLPICRASVSRMPEAVAPKHRNFRRFMSALHHRGLCEDESTNPSIIFSAGILQLRVGAGGVDDFAADHGEQGFDAFQFTMVGGKIVYAAGDRKSTRLN